MTEVPEHLLRRSRERRAALGLGGDAPAAEPSAPTEAEATPAPAEVAPAPAAREAPTPPAEVERESPKPEPVYIQAAKSRKRVPYWAMAVLVILPIWGVVYFQTLEPVEVEETPFALGQELYGASCASCHGGGGEGGSGPPLVDGAVVETWPDFRDHMMWVRLGAQDWPASTYGAQDASPSAMPSFRQLTDEELAQVVLFERSLSGEEGLGETAEESDEQFEELFAIAEGEMTFADTGLGELSEEAGVSEDELAG